MLARQQRLEEKITTQERSLEGMRDQIQMLQTNVMDLLKAQFSKLAVAITERLQLPQQQAKMLRDLLDDHLHQLPLNTSLELPTGVSQMITTHHTSTEEETTLTSGPTQPRDPRLRQPIEQINI